MDEVTDLLELIRSFQNAKPEVAPIWLAKRRLAAVLREYANTIGSSGASDTEIQELAALFEENLPRLATVKAADSGGGGKLSDKIAGEVAPGMQDFYDRGPMTGQSNPIAPPAELRIDIDKRIVVGDVTFGRAFEGAPGCLHGGFVSSILDEALGMACIFAGGPAMTGELTIRFRKHTPIESPLTIEARMDRVSGRKVETSGELRSGDVVVADATGLFIVVGSEKFAALMDARERDKR